MLLDRPGWQDCRMSHRYPFPGVLLALGLMALAACDRRPKEEPPPPPAPKSVQPAAQNATDAATGHALPAGIAWFAGDVDAAFAAARTADKPVFLYWGAEWCPPCAQIKSTIFNRREFQERSRLFVPVYLDGDTPSAQKQGERFGVVGYPTMILFKPDGTEITRLPGGVDVERYARILDVALAEARPVSDLLAAARRGEAISNDAWRLLAYYSWGSDNGRVMPADQRLPAFRQLAARCPAADLPGECARLTFDYLNAAAAGTGPGKPAFDGLERADARRQLLGLLPLATVRAANVDNLLYGAKEIVGLLSDAGSVERRELTKAWGAALDALGAPGGPALSPPEQLLQVRARVLLARLDNPDAPLPPALVEQARAQVAKIDATVTDGYARHAAINAAANLYWEAGLADDANRLLSAELARSKAPYYFMLDLAELAKKAGRKQEAVQWLERAYAGAQGSATRFQWGYSYLVGLLEMTPEDTAAIERAGLAVIGELDGAPDAFYQRTRMRLEQLDGKLLDWGKSGAPAGRVVGKLRTRTEEICRKLPADDPGRVNCEKFLNPQPRASHAA
jgi:thiol-disulfide isomerase/thioredoxin